MTTPNLQQAGSTSGRRLRVAYVLKSFPEPSETFVADEIASLDQASLDYAVLHVYQGNLAVVHPTARAVLATGRVFKLGGVSVKSAMKALARLALQSPWRSLRVAAKAMFHPDRWCYVQSITAAAWCRDKEVDFLHAHFADVNLMYASAIADWTGIPYGVTTHRYDILDDPLELQTARKLLRSASAVVTISKFNRDLMAEKYGLAAESIHVIHCGVDLTRFAYRDARVPSQIEPLRLLNVGRLTPIKAQDILLRAVDIVRRQGIRFHLDVIGGGELHADLLQLARDLELSDVVTFHGAQPEGVVRQMLSNAHMFCLSSRSEGLPVACIEALAVGTPVVATSIFGIPELITDGVSGLLVPPDDPKALADAVVRAAQDPMLRQRMSTAGRKVVEQAFDRDACTRQLSKVWRIACVGTAG